MATSQKIEERMSAFVVALADELGEVDDSNALSWLDAIESQAVEIGDAISAALLERRAAELPTSAEESTCPECGKLGRYQGRRERELISRRGPATIGEPEYYCPACRRAFFPGDPNDRRRGRLSIHAGDAAEGFLRRRQVAVVRRGDPGLGRVG